MKRKSEVSDLSLRAQPLTVPKNVKLLRKPPAILPQRMHQIKIDMILLQALELLRKNALHIRDRLYRPQRQLCRQIIRIPRIPCKRLARDHLAHAAVVRIRRVKVCDPRLVRPVDHGKRFLLVDAAVRVCREPHTAKPQQ